MTIVSESEFQDYFRSQIPADQLHIQMALAATDSVVQEYCGRQFAVAGTPAARTYRPSGDPVLKVHDFTTLTSVVEDGTTLTVDVDFVKWPVQAVSWTGEATPYNALRKPAGYRWCEYDVASTVVVTAAWGWAAVPAAVKQAAMITAKEILDQREVRFGIAAVNDFGPLRIRPNPEVEKLLAPYRSVSANWLVA